MGKDNDMYMINPDEVKDIKSGLKTNSAGVICPKMNKQIGEPCNVCEALQPLWKYPKNSPERDLASSKKAKVNFYINVVLPEDPSKSYILELGKNAGNEIIDGIEKKGWNDIVHPKAGMGRELTITKGQNSSGYNTYSVSPVLNKAEYDVPDEVLDNLPNLDNMIDMIKNGELDDDNLIRVSDIKMGSIFTFRMCPKSKDAKFFKFIAWVWRHWGNVTYDEVDGNTPVNLSTVETKDNDDINKASDTPWDNDASKQQTDVKEEVKSEPVNEQQKHQPCFGKPEFFDASDEDCQECDDFKLCKKACKAAL